MNFYTTSEIKLFKRLNTFAKIQDYLEALKINFETGGETCMSPRFVIKTKKAHCMEGAMFAAAALEFHGHRPLVMDLRAIDKDFDHVVALFQQSGYWGAMSKTNHAVLRFREPVYKTVRELAMSYFHEYFTDNGKKTLREFSAPLDLRYFDTHQNTKGQPKAVTWRTSEKNLFEVPKYLDTIKHFKILTPTQIKNLRRADKIEIQAGKLVTWKR